MIKLKKIYKIKSTVFILVLIFLLFSSCNNKITTAPSYLIDTPTTKWASPEQQRQAFFDKLGLTYTTKLVFTPACKHLEHVNFDDLIVNENDKNYYKTLSAQYAQIPEGYVAPIYIQWINHTIGHGVFALQAIEKNDYILAYTGQVQKFNSNTTWCWDYPTQGKFRFDQTIYGINAQYCGNEGRFINDGEHPNVVAEMIYHHGAWHMIYVAQRKIKVGEQLLVSYGTAYWEARPKAVL